MTMIKKSGFSMYASLSRDTLCKACYLVGMLLSSGVYLYDLG